MRKCPRCGNPHYHLYGHTYYGKQRYRCLECHRQYVDNPTRQPISVEKIQLINKLRLEGLSIAAISRVTGVSPRWIEAYFKQMSQSKKD